MRTCSALVASLLIPASVLAQGRTHQFTPTSGVRTFAVRPPVLTIAPGDVIKNKTIRWPRVRRKD